MNSEDLKERTKQFGHRCVKLAMALPATALGNAIRAQLVRSAPSVAANYRAACLAQSRLSFKAKLSIVLEEADESWFWIEFLKDEKLVAPKLVAPLLQEAEELTRIFAKSRKTAEGKKSNTKE